MFKNKDDLNRVMEDIKQIKRELYNEIYEAPNEGILSKISRLNREVKNINHTLKNELQKEVDRLNNLNSDLSAELLNLKKIVIEVTNDYYERFPVEDNFNVSKKKR